MTIHILKNKCIAMVSFTIAIFFLGSCQNDIEQVHKLTQGENFPLKVQYDVHFEYSDSARKQIDIRAPEAADFAFVVSSCNAAAVSSSVADCVSVRADKLVEDTDILSACAWTILVFSTIVATVSESFISERL